jgi:hypothetical protein
MTENGKLCLKRTLNESGVKILNDILMDDLVHVLADEASISAVECMTLSKEIDGDKWLDLDSDDIEVLSREILYLEWRGLLRHHPTDPNLVQIVEVPA